MMSDVAYVLNRYPFLLWLLAQRGMKDPLLIDSAKLACFRPSLLLRRPRKLIGQNGYEDFEEISLVKVDEDTRSWEVLSDVNPAIWRKGATSTYRKIQDGEQVVDALLRVDKTQLTYIVLISSFAKGVSCTFHHDRVVTEPVRTVSLTLYGWQKESALIGARHLLKSAA